MPKNWRRALADEKARIALARKTGSPRTALGRFYVELGDDPLNYRLQEARPATLPPYLPAPC